LKVDVVNLVPNEVLGRAYGPTVQLRSLLATGTLAHRQHLPRGPYRQLCSDNPVFAWYRGTLTHRQHLPRGPEQSPIPRALQCSFKGGVV